LGLEDLDRARYPIVAEYLAGVPNGLDGHPQCSAKASLYRFVLDERPLADTDGLPGVLAELVDHPRPVNTWIPEVHSHALMLAVYDRSFGDVDRFAAFCYETQRKLWASKIYVVLMRWTSPQRLLSTGSARWQLFHRGSTLKIEARDDDRATLRLEHPAGLYDHISRVGLTEGLRAALDMSTRYRCSIEQVDASPTGARWTATWSAK
jgi:hypothetical protein